MRVRWSTWGFVLSAALHVGVAAGVVSLPKGTITRRTTVAVVDKKKKEEKKRDDKRDDEPPPPPPKPPEPVKKALPKPKAPENTPPPPPPAAAPAPAAPAPHPVLNALPNLGISMAGGPGAGGIAVPQGPAANAAPAGGPIEAAKPPPRPTNECTEEAVKPKMLGSIDQFRIMAAAQAAGGVEGKIRLVLQVDEAGNVISVQVSGGLGGAVDEAAMAAAKRVRFNPGTKCGKPAAATFRITVTVRNPD